MNLIASVRSNEEYKQKIIPTLIDMGITNFRLNFSRGDINSHIELISYIRELELINKVKYSIFVDLPGSKIRLGTFKNKIENLKAGDYFIIDTDLTEFGDNRLASINKKEILDYIEIGDVISTANESENLKVIKIENGRIICNIEKNSRIFNLCGITITNKYIPNYTLSNRDREIIHEVGEKVDYICPSFVDNIPILNQLKELGYPTEKTKIISKIESPIGLSNLNSIIEKSDGVMLCRGDLKSFYSYEQMHYIGKNMLDNARASNKTVIFASDYFTGMIYGKKLSENEIKIIKLVLDDSPDYLLINETTRAQNWFDIITTAIDKLEIDKI